MKPFVTYSENLTSPDAAVDLLEKAVATALKQRDVPHMSVPKDLFMKRTSAQPRPMAEVIQGTAVFTKESLEKAASIMRSAKRPMILVGSGAAGCADELQNLAERWGAGILLSLGGNGLIEESAPLMLQGIGEGGNPYASELFKEADVVLLADTTWWPEGHVPTDARVIQIDPYYNQIEENIPVELGIAGKSEEVLPLLNEHLENFSPSREWVARFQEVKDQWARQNEKEGNTGGYPVHPSRIIRALDRTVAPDAILALDTGDHTVWTNRNFRQTNQTTVFSGYWRTMGFGLPGAMTAKLIHPEKQVVAIVGDDGLQMVLADLLTAIRYGLHITGVVMNNKSLQMEKDKIDVMGTKDIGTDLTNPDFVKLAEACGWEGFRPKPDAELKSVLEEALNTGGPALVDIKTAQVFFPETE